MKVHAKILYHGKVQDFYFDNPEVVLTEKDYDVFTALEVVEDYVKRGYFSVPVLSYEANGVSGDLNAPFIIGIYDKYSREDIFNRSEPYSLSELTFSETQEEIENSIEKVRDYIRDGHTYQVNYTTRLTGEFHGDGHALFKQLMSNNNGHYAFYIEHNDERIISCSPELFFKVEGDVVTTRPMKGTSKRHNEVDKDRESYEFLKSSKKDQAENVMIVDLLRNDLSKIATKGSVTVPKLFDIEKYATVFQMTSTIEARISDSVTIVDIIRGLYPCGSITGAPKLSTMKIIEALEISERGYYCGTIGLVMSPRDMVFNVPIRTIQVKGSSVTYGVGAGITYDSNPTDEYHEIVAKTLFLDNGYHKLIESMRIEDGQLKRLNYHVKRLMNSVQHFGFKEVDVLSQVETYIEHEGLTGDNYKLRLLYSANGDIEFSHESLEETVSMKSTIHDKPLESHSDYITHKTSIRYHYQILDDSMLNLYYNNKHEITEFNIGNVVILENDSFYTPPTSVGLLNGVMRQALLDEGKLIERIYHVSELVDKYLNGTIKIFMINSVREWVPISLEDRGVR